MYKTSANKHHGKKIKKSVTSFRVTCEPSEPAYEQRIVLDEKHQHNFASQVCLVRKHGISMFVCVCACVHVCVFCLETEWIVSSWQGQDVSCPGVWSQDPSQWWSAARVCHQLQPPESLLCWWVIMMVMVLAVVSIGLYLTDKGEDRPLYKLNKNVGIKASKVIII